jgi:cytochrome c oxidase subunit 2
MWMNHRPGWRRRGTFLLLMLASVLLVSGCTSKINGLNSITDRGDKVVWLANLSFILSFIVMAMVFIILLYVLVRFRGGGEASPREGHKWLEITWATIPAVLLVVLFVLTIRTVINTSEKHADGAEVLHVTVTGKQWWWEVQYPDLGISTANELHLPVDRPVEVTLQAGDVIHSLWIPEIGWKLDNIPGKTNTLDFTLHQTGTYDGACAEFCGVQHAWMRIKLYSQPTGDFDAWADANAAPAAFPSDQLSRDGQATFLAQSCASCHTISGVSAHSDVGPDLTHFGSRETIGGGVVANTDENLKAWIENPQAIKPGVLMPGFDGLTDDEIEALLAYLKGLK